MNRWYMRRQWITLGLLLLLAADAAVYFGWLRRPAASPETDPAQLESLNEEVARRAAEVARLERVREQAPRFRPQIEKFGAERLLAEQTGFSRVAAELDEAAGDAGVVLGRVGYQSAVERTQPEFLRVEITTSVEGQYGELLRYLEALEHSPHLYLINELTVEGAERGRLRLQMRLATYFRRKAA